jgi:hypothetical protein
MTRPVYQIRSVDLTRIDSPSLQAWSALEARAFTPNAFLSPHFVMPALKHLLPGQRALAFFVEESNDSLPRPTLAAVALFLEGKPTLKFPLPHLVAFETIHSYLTGFLVDAERREAALAALFAHLTKAGSPWRALVFNTRSAEDLPEEAEIAKGFGCVWHTKESWQRGTIWTNECDGRALQDVPRRMVKHHQRNLRRLSEIKPVEWQLRWGESIPAEALQTFLTLENMGWKGEAGTSLLANPPQRAFFDEMVAGFRAENRVFVTSLNLGGESIASTVNLTSGRVGFGFKLGWNPEYTKMAPGMVNEMEMMQNGAPFLQAIDLMDSCAAPDSFMQKLWLRPRTLASGYYVWGSLPTLLMRGMEKARSLRRKQEPAAPASETDEE